MKKIIDIERLIEMPITKKFAELLFGKDCDHKKVRVFSKNEKSSVIWSYVAAWKHQQEFTVSTNGNIIYDIFGKYASVSKEIYNGVQIVRYIDAYLDSVPCEETMLVKITKSSGKEWYKNDKDKIIEVYKNQVKYPTVTQVVYVMANDKENGRVILIEHCEEYKKN